MLEMTNEDYRKEITMLIGKVLAAKLEEKNMTQKDIAKMLNSDDIFEVCEMKHSARNRICNIAEYRISILREKDM